MRTIAIELFCLLVVFVNDSGREGSGATVQVVTHDRAFEPILDADYRKK